MSLVSRVECTSGSKIYFLYAPVIRRDTTYGGILGFGAVGNVATAADYGTEKVYLVVILCVRSMSSVVRLQYMPLLKPL